MADYKDRYYTSSDGLRLHYRDYDAAGTGDGVETVLCMPGLTRNARDFTEVADHLKGRYRVLVAEQRGRGLSAWDPNPANYHPGTYIGDMFTLLADAGATRVHAIGTSLGGLMTMIISSMKPGFFKSATLNDIGPVIEQTGIERIKGYVGKITPEKDWTEATQRVKAMAADVYPDFTDAEWDSFTRKIFVEKDGHPILDYDPNIALPFKNATSEAAPTDIWPAFESLKGTPLAVLRGGLSDLLSAETMEEMGRRHEGMVAVTIPNVGHTPILNEPECLAAIDAVIAKGT